MNGDGDNLDMTDGRDRRLVQRAVRERWPIAPEFRDRLLQALEGALEAAQHPGDVSSIVKTAAVLDGLNIKWAELLDKHARLDEGRPTENVRLVIEFDSPMDEEAPPE